MKTSIFVSLLFIQISNTGNAVEADIFDTKESDLDAISNCMNALRKHGSPLIDTVTEQLRTKFHQVLVDRLAHGAYKHIQFGYCTGPNIPGTLSHDRPIDCTVEKGGEQKDSRTGAHKKRDRHVE